MLNSCAQVCEQIFLKMLSIKLSIILIVSLKECVCQELRCHKKQKRSELIMKEFICAVLSAQSYHAGEELFITSATIGRDDYLTTFFVGSFLSAYSLAALCRKVVPLVISLRSSR